MGNFIVEPYPPTPKTGMSTGKLPAGVRVTDRRTGAYVIATESRRMYQNRDAAIRELEGKYRALLTQEEGG